MKILLIGNGGREHAIAAKLSESHSVEKIYCAPGNGGTANENKCENVNITDLEKLAAFAGEKGIDITVVGPEAPLVEGITDLFKNKGLKIFGPSGEGAKLEGSKIYSKKFMKKYGVKTAEYEVFEEFGAAAEYIKTCSYPVVIKADGLAAGKGVVICKDELEAEKTLQDFMVGDIFKGSGKKIVVEEFLEGVEASILSITDGNVMLPFISAKDHKQIFDGNEGPNTGGMGAIAPNPFCSKEVLKDFEQNVLKPTLKGIQEEKLDYTGIVFFGIMITKKGVYNLEYNVRMGDPETQVVLTMMDSDFAELIKYAVDGKLKDFNIKWKAGHACCVAAVSGGYPGSYKTGCEINILEDIECSVFHAGTKLENGKLLTSGGRVLCTSAAASTLKEARETAYRNLEKIDFKDIYYRRDIGKVDLPGEN